MASNRHLGRILALQTLYEYDFRRDCGDEQIAILEILQRNIKRYSDTVDDQAFVENLVTGVSKYAPNLDLLLQPVAPDWPIDQIARMDRLVLEMSVYELINGGDVPPKVVINEAVELSKAFGGENSSKFVNGVLGTIWRSIEDKTLELPKELQFDQVPKKQAKSQKETE